MIIIDVSNLSYAAMFQHIAMQNNDPIHEGLLRHLVVNSLRNNVKKFKSKYASSPKSVVLAFDSPTYWRRELFPHYKASRARARTNSLFDWASIHTHMHTIMDELVAHTPYTSVRVDGAEADDVIGTLVPIYVKYKQEPVMIVSGDKDFPQLQVYPGVSQWAPVLKKFIVESAPDMQLKQLIIRGDKDDGIPNILSPDDVFVTGKRQRPISEKKLVQWLTQAPEVFCNEDMLRNYYRNQKLIDLSHIPTALQYEISCAHDTAPRASKAQFLEYLVKKQLGQLSAVIDEF